jgi:prepilin-type N-terminal cleavage/methylation domain-containing protein
MMPPSIKKRRQRGFTLIEVIVSIILLGVVSAGVGLGIVKIIDAYFFTKTNAQTVQRVQVAMTRIAKELNSATAVTAASGNSIIFNKGTASATIRLNGSTVQIDGAILIDNVSAFTLTYFDAAGAATALPAAIRRIDIGMAVTGADNVSLAFKDSVTILESYR